MIAMSMIFTATHAILDPAHATFDWTTYAKLDIFRFYTYFLYQKQ